MSQLIKRGLYQHTTLARKCINTKCQSIIDLVIKKETFNKTKLHHQVRKYELIIKKYHQTMMKYQHMTTVIY